MYELAVIHDHLSVRITLTVNHPYGTREFEGLGSSIGESLQDLADNVQYEEY